MGQGISHEVGTGRVIIQDTDSKDQYIADNYVEELMLTPDVVVKLDTLANAVTTTDYILSEDMTKGDPAILIDASGTPKLAALASEADYINFAGIVEASGLTGEVVPLTLVEGKSPAFTGQIAGTVAHIQVNGSISTVDNSKPIGRFLNATTLLITKNP